MRMLTTVALVAAMAIAGCSDAPKETSDPTPGAGSGVPTGTGLGAGSANSGQPAPNTVEYFRQVVGDRVFFATDQFAIDSAARSTLDRQAQWLNANPGTSVTIEGHADERGTRQYNLALGARRANSVREYLVSQGISANRLRATTFGKERPVALCSDDSCWSQNRRSVSVVSGSPTS